MFNVTGTPPTQYGTVWGVTNTPILGVDNFTTNYPNPIPWTDYITTTTVGGIGFYYLRGYYITNGFTFYGDFVFDNDFTY